MDTVYPEPMSRLHRRVVPKKRKGGSTRYRTQPVTFSEIQVSTFHPRFCVGLLFVMKLFFKEVDEENVEDPLPVATTSKSELNLLNKKFEEFKRTRDLDTLLKYEQNDPQTDINKNPVPLGRILNKLPSRPSF